MAKPVTKKPVAKPVPPPLTVAEHAEIAGLKSAVRSWRGRAETAEKELCGATEAKRAAVGLRGVPAEPFIWPSAGMKPNPAGVVSFLWSDWHIGETVLASETHGVNSYDRGVAERRVEMLVERSIMLATTHVAKPNTDYAVLYLNGDFVSGWQHDEHLASDWCTPFESVRYAASYIRSAIRRILQAFKKMVVVCCVGNHGRLFHKKPPAKLQVHQSFDWLIYGFLEEAFGGDHRVTFATPSTGDYLLTVEGWRYLVMHGHELGVKGGDALIGLAGPMVRGRLKVGRAAASFGRDFDTLILSHFHDATWLPGQGVIVNGCLVGYNEYALSRRYVATTPSQWLWWTDRHWGPVCPMQVYVDEPVRARAAAPTIQVGR